MELLVMIYIFTLVSAGNREQRLYIAGSVLMLASAMIIWPKNRHFVFLVPIFIFSAGLLHKAVSGLQLKHRLAGIVKRISSPVLCGALLIVLSSGPTSTQLNDQPGGAMWVTIIDTIRSDVKNNDVKILENRTNDFYYNPMKPLFAKLAGSAQGCRGLMSLEYAYFGAFIDFPVHALYDIWEIPPFGTWEKQDSTYRGLSPDRVNCFFVSNHLKYGPSAGTNTVLRYQNYIQPYAEYLMKNGVVRETVEGYGDVIRLL